MFMPNPRRNRLSATLLLLLFPPLLFPPPAGAVNPPWYLLRNQIAAAVGADPAVRVDALDTTTSPYRIPIHVTDPEKAQALGSVLKPHYEMGNIAVDVVVFDGFGEHIEPFPLVSTARLAEALQTAFGSNPLFICAFERLGSDVPPREVDVVFHRVLVQYPSGDTAELFGNTNVSAASVFADILELEHGELSVRLGTAIKSSAKSERASSTGSRARLAPARPRFR